jgi:uncharacterized membrane protein required for colicin V production
MNSDPSILDLLRQLRDDTGELIREEVRLAKTEISEKLARAGRNVAYLSIGGLIASSALVILLIAFGNLLSGVFIDRGLSVGTGTFLGFLVVALVVAGIAAAMVMKSLKALANDSLAPTRTARSLQEDKQWAKDKLP